MIYISFQNRRCVSSESAEGQPEDVSFILQIWRRNISSLSDAH